MTRKRRSPPQTPEATPTAGPPPQTGVRAPSPAQLAPVDFDVLSLGGTKPPTSMTLATAHQVNAKAYTKHERQAAILAMDYSSGARDALSFVEATAWPGFPTLSLLAQLPEYRTMHETLADEVVRKWGQITSTSEDEAVAEKINHLTQVLDRLCVRNLIRTATIHDQAFGGAHIFPRMKANDSDLPADAPLLMEPTFFAQNSLQSFVAIEPYWVTPNAYNSTDPTSPYFYKPETWYMLAKVVHSSRMYTMVSRPVADMLKAAYSFRGVSMSQLAMPYVDNWLRTRQSVSDTVKQFSVTYLKTDMAQMLQPGGAYSLINRAQLFNITRDNRNLGLCDMTTEDFAQLNTPLAGLAELQAQSQEQMSAVSHIPLVKLTGITPAGLNANSDGEIRVWYDYVAGFQSHNITPLMLWILQLVQLSEYGAIDPGLSWDWNPLYELTDVELADVRAKNAQTDMAYFEAGIVSGEMVQDRLSADPLSSYASILANRDPLEGIKDLAVGMIESALTPPAPAPQPQQAQTDDPDDRQSDPQAAPAVAG